MTISLNDVFHLNQTEIKNSKIELNMRAGRHGEYFLDRWFKHSLIEKKDGHGPNWDCSFWGWYGTKQRNFQKGQWVFSFVRIPKTDNEWLLVSAAEIVDTPKHTWAKVSILRRFTPYFGRLVMVCYKGNTMSRYVFRLSKFLESAKVKEILPCVYSAEKFEGYDKVHLPYSKLAAMFEGKILPTYKEALEQISGIYCLTDTHTGKLYIGSAYGEGGLAKRWGEYFRSKDGKNKKLIDLHNKKKDIYFEKYFTFTLLEFFGKNCDKNKIIAREQYWKECLSTRTNGYNAN